jgi:hypothetical protein
MVVSWWQLIEEYGKAGRTARLAVDGVAGQFQRVDVQRSILASNEQSASCGRVVDELCVERAHARTHHRAAATRLCPGGPTPRASPRPGTHRAWHACACLWCVLEVVLQRAAVGYVVQSRLPRSALSILAASMDDSLHLTTLTCSE